jgi:hypothetical protein
MKVRILKSTDPKSWYADRVGKEIEVNFSPVEIDSIRHVVAKTWNYYWDRENLEMIPFSDIEITEDSGSDFQDGYDLGVVVGMQKKEKELIDEGILEDFDDEN